MAPKRHVERKRRSSLNEQGFLLENFLFPAKNPSLEKKWQVNRSEKLNHFKLGLELYKYVIFVL